MDNTTRTFIQDMIDCLPDLSDAMMQDWSDRKSELRTFLLGLRSRNLTPRAPAEDDGNTIVLVDRTILPTYQDWMGKTLHPEFQTTGPPSFDVRALELWSQPVKMPGLVKCQVIYDHLAHTHLLEGCANLRDLEEIERKGIDFFLRYWQGLSLFAFKSVLYRGGEIVVPYLDVRKGKLVLDRHWLGDDWHSNYRALILAT